MCGIAGIAGIGDSRDINPLRIEAMCQALLHRGPDEGGSYCKGRIGLGMRRLSIIDLAGGKQPIHNEDRSLWIVYNGEVYNFPELRKQLQAAGHRFYTNTDTETIIHAYEDLGPKCLDRLRGMFAFAIYDSRDESLFIARDRLGKKPLYYSLTDGEFLFGSEIKSILTVAPELMEIDQQTILHFFHFGYSPDPLTAFRGIRQLPPGHYLHLKEGKIRIEKYWDLPKFCSDPITSEDEALEILESKLAEAVKIRLISDVPVGAFLSGGVDSSTIVGLMARASGSPVKTFSIGFKDEEFNEAAYARQVAVRFSTEHHELFVDPAVEETLQLLTRSLEEPFADPSMVPTYHISALARQHVTVALSGDGGDEAFAGYDRYEVHASRSKWNFFPGKTGEMYRNYIHPKLPFGTLGRQFLYNLSLQTDERYLNSVSFAGKERNLFSKDYLAWADAQPHPFRLFQQYQNEGATDPISAAQYTDTKTYLPGDILTKVDRMSMLTSLEVRVPLLDHEVFEWAAKLPIEMKVKAKQRKYLLRKLAEKIGVPSEVMNRPKRGFAMPLKNWLRHDLKELTHILTEPRTLQRGYFNKIQIEHLLAEHFRGRRDWSLEIWQLLIFELWHRNFLEFRMPAIRAFHSATPSSMEATISTR
jgi:asparagine synthase (glutamine-hydrolysing)